MASEMSASTTQAEERLAASACFTRVDSEPAGVPIYLLNERVAPLQQSLYYVNSGMTSDGRFLWFMAAFPPNPHKSLAVVDLERDMVRHFPETSAEGAYVDPRSGDAYFTVGPAIWRRSAACDDEPTLVNRLPGEMIGHRQFNRLATHLTRSADGREFFVDSHFGLQWWIGTLPIDGGDYQPWCRLDRNYNHAQISPTDPDVGLFSQEFHFDPITGLRIRATNRMWMIRRGGQPEPVLRDPPGMTHEFWEPSGTHAWGMVGGSREMLRINIASRETERIEGADHCWHGHCTVGADAFVHDAVHHMEFFRGCPNAVYFVDRLHGRSVEIVRHGVTEGIEAAYHIDPHPRFCGADAFVVFTTTIRGKVDLAVVRTGDLFERTRG